MPTGNVKWFDTKKGYGFIIGDGGKDVFVHYSSIVGDGFRSLKDGELVDYELVQSDKGLQARNVRRLTAPEPASAAAPQTAAAGLQPGQGSMGSQGAAAP